MSVPSMRVDLPEYAADLARRVAAADCGVVAALVAEQAAWIVALVHSDKGTAPLWEVFKTAAVSGDFAAADAAERRYDDVKRGVGAMRRAADEAAYGLIDLAQRREDAAVAVERAATPGRSFGDAPSELRAAVDAAAAVNAVAEVVAITARAAFGTAQGFRTNPRSGESYGYVVSVGLGREYGERLDWLAANAERWLKETS